MNENYEQPSDAAFICDFGTGRLDIPFAQQPSLREFLDVPMSEEGRVIPDELLRRFLIIVDCVIQQKLADSNQVLAELNIGYELWKALTPDVEDGTRKPEDLLESRWIGQHNTSFPSQSETDVVLPQFVGQLIKRCQEETVRRINSELLLNKSLYVLIYGLSQPVSGAYSLKRRKFGIPGCSCAIGGRQYAEDCQTECSPS